jgi:hypothetical protein
MLNPLTKAEPEQIGTTLWSFPWRGKVVGEHWPTGHKVEIAGSS